MTLDPREPVDVAIVGAGVIGAATAYYLAQAAPHLRIALLEQDHVGSGSTARSFAAYRKQFRSRIHVLASAVSQREFERFEEIAGHDVGLRQIGYLFLYRDPDALERAAGAVALQRECGVDDVAVLRGDDVRGRFPFVDSPVAGATWCPSDGYLDPLAVAAGYAEAARRLGVAIVQGTRVDAVEVAGGRVQGVRLGQDLVRAEQVVLATGAWMRALAPHVPIAPVKRYVYISPRIKERDVSGFPMTVLDLGPYVRSEARESLAWGFDERPTELAPGEIPRAAPLPPEPDYTIEPGYGRDHDEYGFEILLRLSEAIGFFLEEEIGIADASCGYYEVTPDHRVIIDRDPGIGGLVLAAGASGHGIMHAPAYGMLTADLLLDRPARIEGGREAFALGPLLAGEARPDPETMII
ncbi:MAG: FAD-binding oxidoreductase [Planctomycetota bacterium]|nr:FAD-binding oxidoreductase [Planctomycetota bacterium]